MKRQLLTIAAVAALTLTGCFGNNDGTTSTTPTSTVTNEKANATATPRNEDNSISQDAPKPKTEEVTCKLDVYLPFLEDDASDMTITFSPQDNSIEKTTVTMTAKDINKGGFTVNLSKTAYTIHISPPKNPDGTTYDMSSTNHDIDIETLANVMENPEITITGSMM